MKSKANLFPEPANPSIDLQAVRERSLRNTLDLLYKPEVAYPRRGDGLDWARKIIARLDAGERGIDLYTELAAKEALGLIKPLSAPAFREPGDDDE